MARVTHSPMSQAQKPVWIGDFLDREHVLPAGGRLDPAQFTPNSDGIRFVPSGTPVGRTVAERESGAGWGPAVDTDDEIYFIVWDCTDADKNPDVDFYRPRSVVKYNLIPGWDSLAAALRTKLNGLYTMIMGAN